MMDISRYVDFFCNLRKKKKKYDKVESELAMRLHAGLVDARKENTTLYRKIVDLKKYITWIEGELVAMAVERDKLLAWWTKYKDRLEKMEADNG